ncbi:alpha/beta fold hydrolase [Microbacterium sp. NIBRBAC000506063]|uniref:alpha/beta fold hydrolase n=1 Tax=Microbacterium sp. NIBRBAC000506063 TaxID=2734618 RepID=UPI001BB76AC2|nr:alpha/beta fold hydrolase [Microbacterium sp. NIBRBAC000506063]QTV80503.1 alpha/beta hydrolase [Microbacterium sp. NIBRBAC000506063]
MTLLFIHGAGGYDDDSPLAEAIGAALGTPAHLPRLPDDDMTFDGWASRIRRALDALEPDDVVAAHSFGASLLVKVLAERVRPLPRRAVLLAMPDWNPRAGPSRSTLSTVRNLCRPSRFITVATTRSCPSPTSPSTLRFCPLPRCILTTQAATSSTG